MWAHLCEVFSSPFKNRSGWPLEVLLVGLWSQAVLPFPGNYPWRAESRAPTPRSSRGAASSPHLLKHQLRLLLPSFRPLQALPSSLSGWIVSESLQTEFKLAVTSGLLISPRAAFPSEVGSQRAPAWRGNCPGCLSGFLLQFCCGRSCPAPPGSGREQESGGEEQLQLRR